MAGKYLKKNKQVITFHTLTALTMLAEAGSEALSKATGADICSILRDGPQEIQVILEDDEAYPVDEEEEKYAMSGYSDEDGGPQRTIIRINGLNPSFARYYIKNPLPGNEDCKNLISDLTNKSQLGSKRNELSTVAGLKTYSLFRKTLERNVGLKDLYSEIRSIKKKDTSLVSSKNKVRSINDRKLEIDGDVEVEMMGNFTNTQVNLMDVYTLNNGLRRLLLAGKGIAYFGTSAVREGITDKCTPDAAYAAVAAYYGVINTKDTVHYSSFKKITPDEYAIMIGKMKYPTMKSEDILRMTNWDGVDRTTETLTRYEAIALAINNLGDKVDDAFNDMLDMCDEADLKGCMFFKDITKRSQYDTVEVAAYYSMGAIKGDESGNANLDEVMTMSKAIRCMFFIIESATTLDIDSTEYIDVDECVSA